jgi:hypothetical protein
LANGAGFLGSSFNHASKSRCVIKDRRPDFLIIRRLLRASSIKLGQANAGKLGRFGWGICEPIAHIFRLSMFWCPRASFNTDVF